MASKRARKRAEFLVTANRGVLADIIPAVANALDQAWEDADNRVVAEREARLERDRAADKLMTDRAYHRGMTRGMRDGIEHGMLLQRNRLAERLRYVFHAVSTEALDNEASKRMWAQLLETIDLIASKMEQGKL